MISATIHGASDGALYGLREDLVKYLGPFIGTAKAGGIHDSIMAEIRKEAGIGASSRVMPIVLGALAVSGVVAAVGIGMMVSSRRKSR